ncbi:MAG: hypothetical protein Q8S13_00700 [Dehalococcoidia bacterium]|nr:hypothetical protein [Dehalococcoidia bacterium]
MAIAPLSDRATTLILQAEGLNQAGKWPGGASGITIGYGYDLGQVKAERFVADWGDVLPVAQLERLKAVIGLGGEKAKAAAPGLADIAIGKDVSLKVFLTRTVPEYQKQTEGAFPGLDKLPPDAQGALVSLVYNRGAKMDGDRRKEMRAIRDAVAKGDLKEIAAQLRAMKRLWEGQGLPGLLKRRDAEAALLESCIA